jgi:hypothetical protein
MLESPFHLTVTKAMAMLFVELHSLPEGVKLVVTSYWAKQLYLEDIRFCKLNPLQLVYTRSHIKPPR